jgi:hypothetical protein
MNRPTLRVELMQALFEGHLGEHLVGKLEKDEDLTVEHRSEPGIDGGGQCHVADSTARVAKGAPPRSADSVRVVAFGYVAATKPLTLRLSQAMRAYTTTVSGRTTIPTPHMPSLSRGAVGM